MYQQHQPGTLQIHIVKHPTPCIYYRKIQLSLHVYRNINPYTLVPIKHTNIIKQTQKHTQRHPILPLASAEIFFFTAKESIASQKSANWKFAKTLKGVQPFDPLVVDAIIASSLSK